MGIQLRERLTAIGAWLHRTFAGEGESSATTRRILAVALFVALVTPGVLVQLRYQKTFWEYTCDDAYISFRYAQSFAAGNGLVFNDGERVEGYSNFLWTALLGAVHVVRDGPMEQTAAVFGFLSAVGMIVYAALITRVLSRSNRVAVFLAAALVGLSASIAYYSTSGLETGFFGFLLTGAAYHFIRRDEGIHAAVAFAYLLMAAVSRPEGPMYLVFAAAFLVIEAAAVRRPFTWATALGLVGACLGLGLFFGFRLLYYGDLLPNTYYAKVPDWILSHDRPGTGMRNVVAFLTDSGGVFLFPLAFLALRNRERSAATMFVIGVIMCGVAFMVYAGFDWMPLHRFVTPVFPLIVAAGVAGIFSRREKPVPSILMALLLVLVVGYQQAGVVTEFRERADRYPNHLMTGASLQEVGADVSEITGGTGTLVTKRIGAVPYVSGLTTWDMFGLTDREIARIMRSHERRDLDPEVPPELDRNWAIATTLIDERRPDYVLLYTNRLPVNANAPTEQEIWSFSYPDAWVYHRAHFTGYRYLKHWNTAVGEWAILLGRP